MSEQKHSLHIFMKLFLSYTCIVLIPFLFMMIMQTFSSDHMKQQNVSLYRNQLNHAVALIDTVTNDIESLADIISLDHDIQSFINSPSITKTDIEKIYKQKDILVKYRFSNSNIQDIFVYSENNKWLIGNGSAVQLTPIMYQASLNFLGMEYDDWLDFVSEKTFNGFYYLDNHELIYIMRLNGYNNGKSILLIHINTSQIKNILSTILPENSAAVVFSQNHLPIITLDMLSTNKHPIIDFVNISDHDQDVLAINDCISFKADTRCGWQTIVIIPERVLHENVYQLVQLLIKVTILSFIISIILSLIFTRNNARPLKRIVANLSSQMPKEYLENKDEYILIENTVATLLEKNTNYEQLNKAQQELISFEIARSMITGEYWKLYTSKKFVSRIGIPAEECCFGVLIAQNLETSTANNHDIFMNSFSNLDAYLFSYPDKLVALVFISRQATQDEWFNIAHGISNKINETANHYRLFISRLCTSAEDIHVAYDECIASMEISKIDKDNPSHEIYVSNNMTVSSEMYYDYPIDMELQIIQALKMGNSAVLNDLLMEIRIKNFSEHHLSAFMVRQLVYEIRGTIIRGLQNYLDDPRIWQHIYNLCSENTIDELFQHIQIICDEMSEILYAKNEKEEDELEKAIYQYFTEHYMDPNLTLHDLTKPFGMNERALYDFIRDHFNSTFSKMLEVIRITKACSLLQEHNMSIQQIATTVGYNSDHTFRLAFKRVMDVAPIEYASAHHL